MDKDKNIEYIRDKQDEYQELLRQRKELNFKILAYEKGISEFIRDKLLACTDLRVVSSEKPVRYEGKLYYLSDNQRYQILYSEALESFYFDFVLIEYTEKGKLRKDLRTVRIKFLSFFAFFQRPTHEECEKFYNSQ